MKYLTRKNELSYAFSSNNIGSVSFIKSLEGKC